MVFEQPRSRNQAVEGNGLTESIATFRKGGWNSSKPVLEVEDNENVRTSKNSIVELGGQSTDCGEGMQCTSANCKFLHPSAWYLKEHCQQGSDCPFSDCDHLHPPRVPRCLRGIKCLRPPNRCNCTHPMIWYLHGPDIECSYGAECFDENCTLRHPASRKVCKDGANCMYSDCEYNHPPRATGICADGALCSLESCVLLHPRSRSERELCAQGAQCPFSDCKNLHPARSPMCMFGDRCKKPQHACSCLHPRLWYMKGPVEKDPTHTSTQMTCHNDEQCRFSDCPHVHPMRTRQECGDGDQCRTLDCDRLHTRSWYQRQRCPQGQQCAFSDCEDLHPPGRAAPCMSGMLCKRSQHVCTCTHPFKWYMKGSSADHSNFCPRGASCMFSDCLNVHMHRDQSVCVDGLGCNLGTCPRMHPRLWYSKDKCSQGLLCPFSDCPDLHPERPAPCLLGMRCKRSPDICSCLHPKEWYAQNLGLPRQCLKGASCYDRDCKCSHPDSRVLCPDNECCKFSDCSYVHPPRPIGPCEKGLQCNFAYCKRLHPRAWYDKQMCPLKDRCPFIDCEHLHPQRDIPALGATSDRASRANPAFTTLGDHDRSEYAVDPFNLRYTQEKISSQFRDGSDVDSTIDNVRHGRISFDVFEPLEVVKVDKDVMRDPNMLQALLGNAENVEKTIQGLHSSVDALLCLSNRRLFVARVACVFGRLKKVAIQQLDLSSRRFQDADRRFSKWVEALAVQNPCRSVQTRSSYAGFDQAAHVVQSMALPAGVGQEIAIVAKDAVCRRLQEESSLPIHCRVDRDRERIVGIDACSPKLLSDFRRITRPLGSLDSLMEWLERQQQNDEINASKEWLEDSQRRQDKEHLAKSSMRDDLSHSKALLRTIHEVHEDCLVEEAESTTRIHPNRKARALGKAIGVFANIGLREKKLSGDRTSENDDAQGFSLTASEEVQSLGLVFDSWPPGYLKIKRVKDGSWADKSGLRSGYYVYTLNGSDLIDMSKEVFIEHLKRRPLIVYVEPPTPEQSEDDASDGLQEQSARG